MICVAMHFVHMRGAYAPKLLRKIRNLLALAAQYACMVM
jgi:hypothetical protein